MKVKELKQHAVDLYTHRKDGSNFGSVWDIFHKACEEYKAYSSRACLKTEEVQFVFICLDLHHTIETYRNSVGMGSLFWKTELDAFDTYVEDNLLPKSKQQLLRIAIKDMDSAIKDPGFEFQTRKAWANLKDILKDSDNE